MEGHPWLLAPAHWCQLFFLLVSAAIFSLQVLLPSNVTRAMTAYGPRLLLGAKGLAAGRSLADVVTSYGRVPHSWFAQFYVLSVSWSVFWALQYLFRGSVMRLVIECQAGGGDGVDAGRTLLAGLLMAAQGGRRLYESWCVVKAGSSRMWVVHWLLGMAFYTAMGVSVWVEGSDAILESWESPVQLHVVTPRNLLGVAVFLFAWARQNKMHRHLASLKKYTLPVDGWFRHIVCPHYTAECLLYVAIAFVAAPPGSLFNKTILSGVVFVITNLGVTASGTKKWYADKFGPETVAERWAMIPFVF